MHVCGCVCVLLWLQHRVRLMWIQNEANGQSHKTNYTKTSTKAQKSMLQNATAGSTQQFGNAFAALTDCCMPYELENELAIELMKKLWWRELRYLWISMETSVKTLYFCLVDFACFYKVFNCYLHFQLSIPCTRCFYPSQITGKVQWQGKSQAFWIWTAKTLQIFTINAFFECRLDARATQVGVGVEWGAWSICARYQTDCEIIKWKNVNVSLNCTEIRFFSLLDAQVRAPWKSEHDHCSQRYESVCVWGWELCVCVCVLGWGLAVWKIKLSIRKTRTAARTPARTT